MWTVTPGGTVVVTNETILFASTFTNINGNGQAKMSTNAIAGWTYTNAFSSTNEIKVGTGSAGGAVTSATYTATGTVRVLTDAHAWGNEGTILWVGVTGQAAKSNQLASTSGRFTNTFEGVDGGIAVSWTSTGKNQRFILEAVEIAELQEDVEETGGETIFVDGYDMRPVDGTTCAVTGLVAETTYYFRVRATAGINTGPWSGDASVTTLAADPAPVPEPDSEEAYDAWLEDKVGELASALPYSSATTNDYDGDGMYDWDEYVCDTNPADSNDVFQVTYTLLDPTSAGEWQMELSLSGASPARGYQKLVWTDLLSAPVEGDIDPGDSSGMSYEIPIGEGCVFGSVRVLLTPPE